MKLHLVAKTGAQTCRVCFDESSDTVDLMQYILDTFLTEKSGNVKVVV